MSADPVKGYHQRGKTLDYVKYLRVWAAQLVRRPYTYMEAFQAMLSGYYSSQLEEPKREVLSGASSCVIVYRFRLLASAGFNSF